MIQNALIYGYSTSLFQSVAARLEELGWNVARMPLTAQFAGSTDELPTNIATPDMVVFFTDPDIGCGKDRIGDGLDYVRIADIYSRNTLSFLRVVESLHKPMLGSPLKRICLVSGSAGSINQSRSTGGYGLSMSLAALNNLVQMLANLMRPEGFTFRLLCADGAEDIPYAGNLAIAYMLRDRSHDPHSGDRRDENRLVPRDLYGRELPF